MGSRRATIERALFSFVCLAASTVQAACGTLDGVFSPEAPGQDEPDARTPCRVGPNVVQNADFTQGNTGFTSDYAFVPPGTLMNTEGQYTVAPNPGQVSIWGTGWTSIAPPEGRPRNLLVANGSPSAGKSVWRQTAPVEPDKTYALAFWAACVDVSCTSVPVLQASINGSQVGPLLTVSLPGGTWTLFSTEWTSGASTTAIVSIDDVNLSRVNNDFAIDEIVLAARCP
jgi:hypothetical protein